MFKWFNKSQANQLASIVPHSEGLAFASISQQGSGQPKLESCVFQSQLSDTQTTLNQLLQQCSKIKQPVTTLLNSSQFTLLLMQKPTVEDSELADAVRWQIKDQLSYPAEEAIIETLEIPGQQERGRLPMIYSVAAHQDTVIASANLFNDTGLDLQFIDIPELAQRNISALLPEDFVGVAVLNLQATHGLLTITHEGELYLSRVIDIGYEHLEIHEQDPVVSDGLSLEDAPSEFDNNINKIVLEIQRSLDYYESHYGKPAIGNLIIAPMENELPTLNDQLEKNLGVVVRSLSLDEIIDTTTELDDEIQAKCFNAVGAALRQAAEVSAQNKLR